MSNPRGPDDETAGFQAAPDDGGMSIDRLAQAFAAMMGEQDPYQVAGAQAVPVAQVDASPDLDEATCATDAATDAACRISPRSILEALLFVGLPAAAPLTGRRVAKLMRGVRPAEIDQLAAELAQQYRANGCPYEVVSQENGWVMRLREEYRQFGAVIEARTRRVRLDAAALDALAVVAWNQPVAGDHLAKLGCDAKPAVFRQLVRRGLLELVKLPVEVNGNTTELTHYRTTPRFLEVFSLRTLNDLPNPHDPPR